ncbi:MAG: hypothetical protein ABSG34_07095, partial [Candidatus Sulfotelmatobacter sp.]
MPSTFYVFSLFRVESVTCMRFLENLFSAFEAFHGDLNNLAKRIHENTEAIKNSDDSQQDHAIPNPLPLVVPEGIEYRKSASDKKSDSDYQDKSLFWQRWTFFALVVYAVFTLMIYCATKKSADAADSAANTAHQALLDTRAIYRPFIVVKDVPVKVDKVAKKFNYSVIVTNASDVPARNLVGSSQVLLGTNEVGKRDPLKPQIVG